jgi:hypothetical protein
MKTDIKLDVNISTGEAIVRVMPHFNKMNTVWQLDALGDWIRDLQELYNEKVDLWEEEVTTFQRGDDGQAG